MRRRFFGALWRDLKVTWPILWGLLTAQAATGVFIAWKEGWTLTDGLYFAFVTGLTIGYGDFAPTLAVTRTLAVGIGLLGILVTGLVAALGVRALQAAAPLDPPGP
jgi:hypothetical protein